MKGFVIQSVRVATAIIGLQSAAAFAAITVDSSTQTNTSSGSNSGFTGFSTAPNAANTTSNAGTSYITNFSTGQGGVTGTSIAQSFQAMATGSLTNIHFLVSGTPDSTFVVKVYDAGATTYTTASNANAPGGAAGNSSGLSDTGFAKYVTTATQPPAYGSSDANGNRFVSTNLLTTATAVTLGGYSVAGNNGVDLNIQFTGADSISLTSGNEYVVELSAFTGSPIFLRNPGTAANQAATEYPFGQAFTGTNGTAAAGSPLNGNAQRDFAVGVTVSVPEPASLGLLALGGGVLLGRKRRV